MDTALRQYHAQPRCRVIREPISGAALFAGFAKSARSFSSSRAHLSTARRVPHQQADKSSRQAAEKRCEQNVADHEVAARRPVFVRKVKRIHGNSRGPIDSDKRGDPQCRWANPNAISGIQLRTRESGDRQPGQQPPHGCGVSVARYNKRHPRGGIYVAYQ